MDKQITNTTTETRRATLIDLAQGGDGKAQGVIYENEDPAAPEHSRYYFVYTLPGSKEATTFYCDTQEHAANLLDLVSGRNELESTRRLLEV